MQAHLPCQLHASLVLKNYEQNTHYSLAMSIKHGREHLEANNKPINAFYFAPELEDKNLLQPSYR